MKLGSVTFILELILKDKCILQLICIWIRIQT